MARITNLEYQQLLAARNTELEAARLRIATLEGDVAALKGQIAKLPAPKPAYVPRQPTPEQLAYRAALAAAREQAMRSGQSVKVGA